MVAIPFSEGCVFVQGSQGSSLIESKTISMRFVGRGLVGVVSETIQPARVFVWLRPNTPPKGEQAD